MLPLKKSLQALTRTKNPDGSRRGNLRLDKNENIIPFPAELLSKLRKTITFDFISAYPEIDSLYQAVARSLGCSPDHIYIASGSDGAIKSVFEAFVGPGDGVVLLSPTYAMFPVYAKMFEARLTEIFYRNDLSLDASLLLTKIRETKPKLICLANPNSPTGTVINPPNLEKIIQTAAAVNAVILIDEAYYLFYQRTCAGWIKRFPNLVVTRTFSKALGLAAARLGFAIAAEELIAGLHKTRPMYETNSFAVQFAQVILANMPVVKNNIEKMKAAKVYLEGELKRLGLSFFKSYANFLLIDFQSRENAAAAEIFLKKKKILVKSHFAVPPLDRCIRINLGNTAQMKIFIRALAILPLDKMLGARRQS